LRRSLEPAVSFRIEHEQFVYTVPANVDLHILRGQACFLAPGCIFQCFRCLDASITNALPTDNAALKFKTEFIKKNSINLEQADVYATRLEKKKVALISRI
jgi:hypothetical protein